MKRLYFTLLYIFAFLSVTYAQVTLKLRAPSQAEVGQHIQVSYVANTQDVEDIEVGEFTGFTVLYGPSTSSSSSFSMINGHTTQSSTLTFTYVISATKAGTFKLPAATIKVNGKAIKSASASIQVLPASGGRNQGGSQGQQQGGAQQQQPQQSRGNASEGRISGKDLYITVTANKKRIYEQEAILLTYKLYTLVNIQQLAGEMPQLDGFHVQELNKDKQQMTLKYERVNGRNYGTAIWKQYILFPQKTGKLTVPSITFDAQVEMQNTSMDPFDVFFGGGSLSQIVRKSLPAPPVNIEVLPLPTPRPANFSGAVGKFTVSGSLTPEQVNANDAATLRLVVSGTGNMKLMKAPTVNFPKDFEVYDPKENDKTSNTAAGAKGNMIYDYVVVPRHGGKFSIAPVEFCYFDPDAHAYRTLKTDSFHIAVAKAKGGSVGNTVEQEDLKVLNNDIRFIKMGNPKAVDSADPFFASTTYWLIYAGLIVAFIALIIIFNQQIKENANTSKMRGKKAGKAATKRLKQAARLLRSHETGAFYDEVMKALLGYAGDKLNLPNADLNKENVAAALAQRGVEQTLVDDYLNVLSECEFARYAPGDPVATMDKIFTNASDAINKLDAVIKKA